MKWHKNTAHTRDDLHLHPRTNVTESADLKQRKKALRAADIISTVEDCSVLVMNHYAWSKLVVYTSRFSKRRTKKAKRVEVMEGTFRPPGSVRHVMRVALSESVPFVSLPDHDTAYQLLCSNRSKRRRQEVNSSEAHQQTFGSRVLESSDVFCSW